MHPYGQSASGHWPPRHSTSFNVASPQEYSPPLQAQAHRPRYNTLPSPPQDMQPSSQPPSLPPHPNPLTPGRRTSTHAPLYTASPNTPAANRYSAYAASPERVPYYGDYFMQPFSSQGPPPPIPQKPNNTTSSPPPIPSKPFNALPNRLSLYPQAIPQARQSGPPPPLPTPPPQFSPPSMSMPVPEIPSPSNPPNPNSPYRGPGYSSPQEDDDDDKDIALAMALSASEARQREEQLYAQEEEELARALAESARLSVPLTPPLSIPETNKASFSGFTEGESWLHLITPTSSLQSVPEPPSRSNTESAPPVVEGGSNHSNPQTPMSMPPLYSTAISGVVAKPYVPSKPQPNYASYPAEPPQLPPSTSSDTFVSSSESGVNLTRSSSGSAVPSSSSQWTSYSGNGSVESAPASARSQDSDGAASTLSPGKSPKHASTSSLQLQSSSSGGLLAPLSEDGEGSRSSDRISTNANHYVEPDLLMGVSLGFSRPAINTILSPMNSALPNVISLPYGKAPLFHFQAPSWRQLLKLMARMSSTRVEPTIEAMTVAKHELKLRTVIQFIRIHHSSSEWRTVLYLTTDMPVPPTLSNSHKYTNGDAATLPYSYGLSALPPLLRDGSESPMAKYYVIPSTSSTPYPTLPIDFPNMAMYLQSAVQDSRNAANDSSSGMRRLAHFIDTCYPNDSEPSRTDEQDTVRRGVGGIFKRVMGRNKAPKSRGNDEIYDLVTPFVPDEWG